MKDKAQELSDKIGKAIDEYPELTTETVVGLLETWKYILLQHDHEKETTEEDEE